MMDNLRPMSEEPKHYKRPFEIFNEGTDYSEIVYYSKSQWEGEKDKVIRFGTNHTLNWGDYAKHKGWRYLVEPPEKVEWESWEGTDFTRRKVSDRIKFTTDRYDSISHVANLYIDEAEVWHSSGFKTTEDAQTALIAAYEEIRKSMPALEV